MSCQEVYSAGSSPRSCKVIKPNFTEWKLNYAKLSDRACRTLAEESQTLPLAEQCKLPIPPLFVRFDRGTEKCCENDRRYMAIELFC